MIDIYVHPQFAIGQLPHFYLNKNPLIITLCLSFTIKNHATSKLFVEKYSKHG